VSESGSRKREQGFCDGGSLLVLDIARGSWHEGWGLRYGTPTGDTTSVQ